MKFARLILFLAMGLFLAQRGREKKNQGKKT